MLLHPYSQAKVKKKVVTTANAGKNAEKFNCSYIAGVNV